MKGHHMSTDNPESKGKGGGKLSRSETVTVRLDPKLRYLTELAARLHRRTSSSYIEWTIKASLDAEPLRPSALRGSVGCNETIGSEAEYLWDVDEADRFAKLALRYPHLLTHEEQVVWKLLRENGTLWKGNFDKATEEWVWSVKEQNLIFDRLREHWTTFNAVVQGEAERSSLPKWSTTKPEQSSGIDDKDEELPF
jgi:hypothetical protein